MKTIELSSITIPASFRRCRPKECKLTTVRNFVRTHGKLDKPIVVNAGNVLADGYVRYLIAKEFGFDKVPVTNVHNTKKKTSNHTEYIVAKFNTGNKQYVWKNPCGLDLNVGDMIQVWTNNSNGKLIKAIVTIVSIFNSDDVELQKHKNVIRKVKG